MIGIFGHILRDVMPSQILKICALAEFGNDNGDGAGLGLLEAVYKHEGLAGSLPTCSARV
jgi:hypothetical protein